MSARTCLLCGKTLVRIRVGAGGDFCSREHRNQYQLRRGMDCLAEANKVATLARRRETPKALFGDASMGSASADRRAFLDPAPFALLAGLNPGLKQTRKDGRAALLPHAVTLAEPLRGVAPPDARREFGIRFALPALTLVPRRPAAAWKPSPLGGRRARGLRAVPVSAVPGNALRVSSSAGFRLKAPAQPTLNYAARPDRAGIAGLSARAGSRPFALRQDPPAAPANARLAFIDMGFSSAPDAPARLDWLGPDRATYIGQGRREL
jgi:hypothetical protein